MPPVQARSDMPTDLARVSSGGFYGEAGTPHGGDWASAVFDDRQESGSGGAAGRAGGTRASGGVAPTACPSPCPRCHLRTRLSFSPCASATTATDAPGSSHAASTLALNSSLCRRRGLLIECIGVHQIQRDTVVNPTTSRRNVGPLDAHVLRGAYRQGPKLPSGQALQISAPPGPNATRKLTRKTPSSMPKMPWNGRSALSRS